MLNTPDTTPASRPPEAQKIGAAPFSRLRSAGRETPDTTCYFVLNYTMNSRDIHLRIAVKLRPDPDTVMLDRARAAFRQSPNSHSGAIGIAPE
jgi:hypothetical protein